MLSTAASTNEGMDQSAATPAASRKFLRTVFPWGVWATSGWNWTAKSFRTGSAIAATGQLSVVARLVKPGGGLSTVSPWLIHTVTSPSASGSTPRSSPSRLRIRSCALPYSRRSAGTTWPPMRKPIACMP